jgi:hypothetical protein
MSFHPITTTHGGARTWNEVSPGRYSESTALFGQPASLLTLRGGRLDAKTNIVSASLGRILEKDVTVAAVQKRLRMSVVCSLLVPSHPSFTVEDVDLAIGILSEFALPASLDQLLKGRQ